MSLTPIKKFHELRLPRKDGGRDGEWCTFDSDECGMFYLLTGGRWALGDLAEMDSDDIPSEVYFETEGKCHAHAYVYYRQHHKPYPYAEQWRNALSDYRINTQPVSDELKSEPMSFK